MRYKTMKTNIVRSAILGYKYANRKLEAEMDSLKGHALRVDVPRLNELRLLQDPERTNTHKITGILRVPTMSDAIMWQKIAVLRNKNTTSDHIVIGLTDSSSEVILTAIMSSKATPEQIAVGAHKIVNKTGLSPIELVHQIREVLHHDELQDADISGIRRVLGFLKRTYPEVMRE